MNKIFILGILIVMALAVYGNALAQTAFPYQIAKTRYVVDNVIINYPQIIELGDQIKQDKINALIKTDALAIKAIASDDYTLQIDYLIKWQSANLLSIVYSGYGYAEGYAGNHVFYTTNINLNLATKLRLKDLVNIDNSFIDKLRDGKFIAVAPEVKGLLASDEFTNENLIKMLNSADSSSTGTTFCYFNNNSLGVSFAIPHVAGDQMQLQVKYKDIFSNIKTSNTIWKEIFTNQTAAVKSPIPY